MTEGAPLIDQSLIEEVRRELELRRLIDEALAQRKKEKESGGVFKHPAVLLLLTFLLTGILGSVLTTCWQNRQWAQQERYRAADQATKDRLETMDYATETIAASIASAEDVLHLFAWSWPRRSEVMTLKERAEYWSDQSRKWRTAEKVLLARVHANFEDPEVDRLLDEIIEKRYRLGNAIENLLWYDDRLHMKFEGQSAKKVATLQKVSGEIIIDVTVGDPEKHIDGKLEQMTSRMLAETERRRPKPKSIFDFSSD